MVGGITSLLAQITGERPVSSPNPSPSLSRPTLPPKRKAEDDLRPDGVKRKSPNPIAQPPSAPSRSTVAQRPKVADKPPSSISRSTATTKPGDKPGDRNGLSHKASASSLARPAASPAAAGAARQNGRPNGAGPRPAVVGPKPAAGTDAAAKPTPKKGSFAEIMARGQRAQAVMGNVGKIQHKKLEVSSKKEKEDPKTARSAQGKKGALSRPEAAKPGPAALSTSRPGSSSARGGRVGVPERGKVVGKAASKPEPEQPEKKRRVPASTGYAGTARPNANTPSTKARKPAPAGGVLLNPNPQLSRYSKAKRDRYEEDDDDMSDFIDYDEDEEEDPRSRRYHYASDGSSDMEAGLDEIDEEEERATYIAKKDDWEELQLEKRLKAEKERRKREAIMRGRR